MKISVHNHVESQLTGSKLSNMIERAKELGRTHFAYTDNGHLSSCLKAYGQAKKAGMKFIPGIEFFFKDSACPIISGTDGGKARYFNATLYCKDQAAYQELCKLVSKTDFSTVTIREEKFNLWSWADLETMAKYSTELVLSSVHCMVGKLVLANQEELAKAVFKRLYDTFGNRLSIAILAEPWEKTYSQVIEINYTDGSKDSILGSDYVSTDKARNIKALDLVTRDGHAEIKSKVTNSMHYEVNKRIDKIKLHKGYLPLPGGDASLRVNKFLVSLAKVYNLRILVTDYAYYANKEDKIVQTMVLEGSTKIHPNLHMKTENEVLGYLQAKMEYSLEEAQEILRNNEEWAKLFDNLELKYEWRLADPGGNPLTIAMDIIKENGRMKWDDPKYVERLREEIEVISKNPKKDLMAYFLPIRDILNHYKENGQLTGLGRGSAGASLLCYLLGITQIDPIIWDLPFQRFFSLDRIMMGELPDIDVDLEDRELLVGPDGKSGYLYGKYGNKAAQISTRTTIRLKSAIKDTNRYFKGKVEEQIEIFTKGLPAPPQGVSDTDFVFGFDSDEEHLPGLAEISDDIKKYMKERPEEWDIVTKALGITRAYGRHASAFCLSDKAVNEILPVKDGNITQYEAKETELAGLIKYDFLVIHQLKDIRTCLNLINKKYNKDYSVGYFDYQNKETYIWNLPQEPEVFKSIWNGSTETIFQISTRSMIPAVMEILPSSIMDLATILALIRPGPADCVDEKTGRNMVEEYYLRRKGQTKSEIKELEETLPETYGTIVFQEQLNKIARQIASFSGPEAETLRKNMAKKKMVELMKMKPKFLAGAEKKISKEVAEKIWDQMVTFGRYGFSIIHAIEYAHITYACMFLKHHYPLEWWAAILTNADEREITGKLWPYVKDLVESPDINLSGDTMVVDYKNNKIRSKLGIVKGLGDKVIGPIIENRPYSDIQDYVNKNIAGRALSHKLIHVGLLDSLFPAGLTSQDKLKMYEDALAIKTYNEYLAECKRIRKRPRLLAPKVGEVPEKYRNLHPMVEASMKKSVLPSLYISTYDLGLRYSKRLTKDFTGRVFNSRNQKTMLVNGQALKRIEEMEPGSFDKNIYVAATAYVIDFSEFAYSKNTKKALKLLLDIDGFVSEKVLWPEYESGKLNYPQELRKGSIITLFFSKRSESKKKDINITEIVVES